MTPYAWPSRAERQARAGGTVVPALPTLAAP